MRADRMCGPLKGMDHSKSSTESRARHLIEAIEQVGDDCWKIEVWTGALLRFASPVPVYDPGNWMQVLGLRADSGSG
jgi:hypothetical protein